MDTHSFKRHLIFGIAFWTGIISALFSYEAYEHWENFKGFSMIEAKSALDKDLVYRRWNTKHGGVYVPVTDETPPNPYLSHIPDRDITLPSGKRLTLMNPSYMTRQVHEIEEEGRGLLGHLTSLSPVNPQNAPDTWERSALRAFEQGSAEASIIADMGGREYLRYMRPLRTEKGCLKCHGHQGYKEGEVRGGLSVSVPLDPLKSLFRKELILEAITYLLTWLAGLGFILFGYRQVASRTAELKENEQRYELFLKNFQGIAYQVVNRSFSPVFLHGTVEQITGYTPVDFLKGTITWDKLVHPEDLQILLGERERFATLPAHIARNQYRIIRKDGQTRWVLDISRTSGESVRGRALLQGAIYDITERKIAEETLRMREEQYRLLFEKNPHPMWVYDLETLAFLAVNTAAVQRYGYAEKEFLTMTIKDIRPSEDIPALLDTVSRAAEGRSESGIWRHRKKDGTLIHVEITSHTIDFNGRRAKLVLAHDVTDRLKAEQDRGVLEEQLHHAQKMEAIGLLAGGVAHDFNNILSAIMGYASIIQMKMGKDDPLISHVQEILSSTERAAGLTQSLLTFSRKQIINPRPVQINNIIWNVEKLLRRLIGEDIEFRALYGPDDLTVMADTAQIEHVLMNLAANARDAMPEGGRLTIEAHRVTIGEDFIREHGFGEEGEYAMISASDTGSGMDEQTRERIFEPFFTTKELGRGTGLGLSIVYGIIRQSQGYIICDSEPGKGTTFRMYLPVTREDKTVETAAESPEIPRGGKETVLIAEDDESVRKLAHSVFEEFGYSVIAASDGEEAIQKFSENSDKVHLVILDVIMPKKNGREVYEEIRKTRPDIKVLFTSGYTAEIVSRQGIGDGEIHFITKPYSPFALLKKSREILDS